MKSRPLGRLKDHTGGSESFLLKERVRNLSEVIRKCPIGVKTSWMFVSQIATFISMTSINSISGGRDLQEVIISQVWTPLKEISALMTLFISSRVWVMRASCNQIFNPQDTDLDWDISVVYKPFWLWHYSGATSTDSGRIFKTNLVTKSTNAALFTEIFHSLKSIQSYLNQLYIICTEGNHLLMYFVHIFY